jgi:polyisoprenoid-binding protein YceI
MMKKSLYVSICVASLLLLGSCENQPKGDDATVKSEQKASDISGQTFAVDTAASYVRFTGYGVGKNHPGKFKLSSGTVAIANNTVTGGTFTMNINSLELEQKEGPIQNKLHPHLLSGDFFDAAKYGTAKFEITEVTPYDGGKDKSLVEGANYNVSGNLTLKEETKNVTFPAKIDLDANTLKATANFDIDRTQWGINYRSDKSLGDKFISEKVNIQLDLQAVKQ